MSPESLVPDISGDYRALVESIENSELHATDLVRKLHRVGVKKVLSASQKSELVQQLCPV